MINGIKDKTHKQDKKFVMRTIWNGKWVDKFSRFLDLYSIPTINQNLLSEGIISR